MCYGEARMGRAANDERGCVMATTAAERVLEAALEAAPEFFLDPLWEAREALAKHFVELPERMDVRYLWSSGQTHYFRVNWWRTNADQLTQSVRRSEFVAIEEDEELRFRVREPVRARVA